jgi:CheY-like chemotaxis protein
LIVDDNVDGANSLALLLKLTGHRAQVAYDGPAALEIARAFQPEVVLLDIGLPLGMDGYEVARQLRGLPGLERAFLVALTGYGQAEDRQRSHAAGLQAHCVKPVSPEVLEDIFAQMPVT